MTSDALHVSAPLTWPETGLRPHRFASIFRMLSGDEKSGFDDDIATRGLQEKIKIFEGCVLDGRNRYLALIDLGEFDPDDDWREFPEFFDEFVGTPGQALDYVWSLNEQRRHDSATQRAAAAARYANLRNVTQAEAAAAFGVSERQVSSAEKVLQHGTPELQQAMDDGRLPGYLAEKVADLDEDEQREVAALPKGDASAKAREKLQDPPPLAESGPVVKPMDASRFVLFAEAVLKTCGMGVPMLSAAVIDGLALEHGLLADGDGVFNLSREASLAVELARKKLSISDAGYIGRSAIIMGAAGLPEDHDALVQAYRNAIVLYDRARRAGDVEGEARYSVAMEAILFKANGHSLNGIAVNEAPASIIASARAPDGIVPMWGQQGCFIAEGGTWQRQEPIRAIVVLGRYNGIYAVDPGQPFPSETGYMTVSWEFRGRDVQQYGADLIGAAIRTFHNAMGNAGKPMPIPQTVYRISEGGNTGPVAVTLEGGELDRTAYQRALASLTEPRGKLHQSTAADAIRAGVAAGVSRAQMAEDLGHPIGTILTWTARLGLTDGSRKGAEA